MKERIFKQLEEAGISEIEIYGIGSEISFLSKYIRKNEIILKASISYLNREDGLFIVTSNRMLFLQRNKDKVNIAEYNPNNILSVVYQKQDVFDVIIIQTSDKRLVLEDVRAKVAAQIVELLGTHCTSNKETNIFN